MVNMTMGLSDKMYAKMKMYSEIKWTEVARQAFERKLSELEVEKEPLRAYAYRRLVEEGEDAEKLFKF